MDVTMTPLSSPPTPTLMNNRVMPEETKTLGNHPYNGLPPHIPGDQLEQPLETRGNHAPIIEEESEFEDNTRYYHPQNTNFYHNGPEKPNIFGEFDKQTLIMFFAIFFIGFLIGNLRRPVILKA